MSSSNDLQLGGSVRKMTGPVVGSKYNLKFLVNNLVFGISCKAIETNMPVGSGLFPKFSFINKKFFFSPN